MPMLPSERLRLLRGRHTDGFTPLQDHCLAALVLRYSNEEAGEILDISPATYRRHVSEMAVKVLEPESLPATRELLITWFWLHTADCTRNALALIERDAVARRRRK